MVLSIPPLMATNTFPLRLIIVKIASCKYKPETREVQRIGSERPEVGKSDD
jgi:hypothetical protein